ncbi:hypothetical protein [Nonomuraea sp. C10]|uniref:hypothetical protein n=1 Tax=Nonomuraea sp. C10 TaxID=2600577 RepID=UPI0011CD7F6D|nr:hypothetical protein [Nonomuraea sp. C10]TXK41812.1 hypothetical protein FR742_21595 [Nonomuraea sp. C10]
MNRFVAFVLMLPVLAACGQAPAAGAYSTGGDPGDDPCARVVSAIGYAGLLLQPAGEEDAQRFEDAVLGRLAEVRGITLQFGPRLPASLGGAVRTVEATTQDLSVASLPRARQVALLKEYRAAAGRIEEGCS